MKKLDQFFTYLAGAIILLALVWAIGPMLGLLLTDLAWWACSAFILYYLSRAAFTMLRCAKQFLHLFIVRRA